MPLRSTDQQPAFGVRCFSAWCAVGLRISVQTASLWQRVRWVASDTTSQTTHQTNTLKALSTLTLYHHTIFIREFIDISIGLQPSINRYAAKGIWTHLSCTLSRFAFMSLMAVFQHAGLWCEHAHCIFPIFFTFQRRLQAADLIPVLTLALLSNIKCFYSTQGGAILVYIGFSAFQHLASWLNWLSETRVMNLHNSQLQSRAWQRLPS